ncbi:formate dehydrogenase subunit gamma [Rhodovulum iodosum]|uniref:Formate dehydrogenase subunit gamma n=1 Tax=Rhodovulum iodosum TaxID=68291 RepID=A0ABV3XTP1_9RHOB|nr:formate dehydrogenase subunit gamma [Rhodovulum robiginosum]RSK41035.1 formate dehydrogenase subunit gamma [Rhodovulum robiginosum]
MDLPDDATARRAREIAGAHAGRDGALLPILHDLQAEFGHIPEAARPEIADAVNISAAELHGVISFYTDFRTAPAGRRSLRLCRAEACQAMGGAALWREVLAGLGLDEFGTTPDGRLTVEPVYCLGLCACAPAAMLDGEPLGRVTADRLSAALAGAAPC